MRNIFLSLALAAATAASADSEYFVKEVVFPADADSVTKIEMASRLVPSPKQLAWHSLELTAFLHFGINTFTDREWGNGSEDPRIFNPADLDADRWVETLKDAGFKMVILTAKHHDGFCLWPTATTAHSVAASPWRDGRGDVVRDLSDACRRHGMRLGLYLSPWDRNAPCYGDSDAYNDMFVAQLTELLSDYGKIDEVWFDGACGEGPNGKKQEYDWLRFKQTMERLQPDAVLAIMGDDVRWVGNEKGLGRLTEWSATALTPGILAGADESNSRLGLFAKSPDLGGRDIVAKADRLYWWPSEVDVSIRPGWFWHQSESPKSLRALADIYINSVGRNSVLLLNVPPDNSGRIASSDSLRLMELRRWIDSNFSRPASGGDSVNCVVIREDISRGQRVESFRIDALTAGHWAEVARGTTVGHKRILLFDPIVADSVRVEVLSSRGTPNLLPLEAYNIVLPPDVDALARDCLDDAAWTRTVDASAVTVDLGAPTPFSGFVYEPRPDVDGGLVLHYIIYVSPDGNNWTALPASGEFSNIVNNPVPQVVFTPGAAARFVRFVALDSSAPLNLSSVKFSLLK